MMRPNASTTLPAVSIGEMLVMCSEMLEIAGNEKHPVKVRLRASKIAQCLDELVERRRKDAE